MLFFIICLGLNGCGFTSGPSEPTPLPTVVSTVMPTVPPLKLANPYTIAGRPYSIVIASDNSTWFTEDGPDNVVHLSMGQESPLQTVQLNSGTTPEGIAIDRSGNVWVAGSGSGTLIEISPPGAVINTINLRKFSGFSNAQPRQMLLGPDGNIWFTDDSAMDNCIGKLVAGVPFCYPNWGDDLAIGPNDSVWFAADTKVGEITSDNTGQAAIEFPIQGNNAIFIVEGPDGNMWYSEYDGDAVSAISPSGKPILSQPITVPDPGTLGEIISADNSLWFGDSNGVIYQLNPSTHIRSPKKEVIGAYIFSLAANASGSHIWYLDLNHRIGYISST